MLQTGTYPGIGSTPLVALLRMVALQLLLGELGAKEAIHFGNIGWVCGQQIGLVKRSSKSQ